MVRWPLRATTKVRPTTSQAVARAQPQTDERSNDPAWSLGETIVGRFDSTVDHDEYTQAGKLNALFDDAHRDRLTTRIAGVLGQARPEVQMRQLCHFFRADEDCGRRVAG